MAARKPPPEKVTESQAPRIHPKLLDRVVPIGDLVEYYKNANEGDIPEIRRSLRRNGQYKTITVNIGTLTDRPNEILAGNHTWIAARQEGWPDIAADFVDVDEKAAARIVAIDNRSAEKASRDPEKLADLLGILEDDLEGSGYTDSDVVKLLEDSADEGEPGDTDPKLSDGYAVIVECTDESHQAELIARFEENGLTCRPLML